MRISISEIANFIDMASNDLLKNYYQIEQVSKIETAVKNKLRTVLYVLYEENDDVINILVVLGNQHGEFDLQYYRQEFELNCDRRCWDFSIIDEKEDRLYAEIKRREYAVVDDSKALYGIDYWTNPKAYNSAEAIKAVSHYTKAKDAISIIDNEVFKANSLNSYKSEKFFSFNENSRWLAHVICFTSVMEPVEKMWEKFGDKHKGCKIDLFFKTTLKQAFDIKDNLTCYDVHGNSYSYSYSQYGDSYTKGVYLKPWFAEVEYQKHLANNANLQIYDQEVTDYVILNNLGKSINKDYDYQKEVRAAFCFHSSERKEIPLIKKIDVPYLIDQIKYIKITIGNKVSDSKRAKLKKLASSRSYIYLCEEDPQL